MTRRTSYFVAAALGAVACLVFLIFNPGEGLTTPLALFAAWTVIMLLLWLRQPA
jgi:hypothetical protein